MVHPHRTETSGPRDVEGLRRDNEVLERTFDSIHVLIAYLDRDFNFVRVNRTYAAADGKTPDFFVGKNHFDLYPHAENRAIFQRVVDSGEAYYAYEKAFAYPDRPAEVTWWDWTLQPLFEDGGAVGGVLLSLVNVTERVRQRLKAEEQEAHFRALFEQAADAIFMLAPDSGRIMEANPAAGRLLGAAGRPPSGCTFAGFGFDEAARERLRRDLATATSHGRAAFYAELVGPEDTKIIVSVSAKVVTQGPSEALLCICRDMTREQEDQDRLQRLNRALETLSACNRALVRADDPVGLLDEVCTTLTGPGGFRFAAAYRLAGDAPPVRRVARGDAAALDAVDGAAGGALDDLIREVSAGDEARVVCGGREGAALAALPLRDAGRPVGALVMVADDCTAFDKLQIDLLMELAEDASFGITTLRVRRERAEGEALLERTFEATIQAIATAVEMRDPYTAGHQRRVAQLATDVAERLGLSANEVRGIHMAGLIHDIGKISIPAEILNRPGRLSAVEFDMIKTHCQSGYDIIKGVELPWPVADMVLQHHERMDGSGYPQGLPGDAVGLGARIIAVADVVEAMSSHRPYRPGRGIEAALAEIAENRGRLYDEAVVDACLAVFRNGFVFEV